MVELLNRCAEYWWLWMSAVTVQVSILIALVFLIELVTRGRLRPELRRALWILVLLKLVLPPTFASPLSLTAPVYTQASALLERIGFLPAAWSQLLRTRSREDGEARDRLSEIARAGREDSPLEDSRPGAPAGERPGSQLPPDSAQGRTPEEPFVSASGASAELGPTWRARLMLLWAGVAALLLAGFSATLRRLRRRLIRSSRTFDSPRVAAAARRAGLGRLPEVRVSGLVATPAVFGIFRPLILLPEERLEAFREEDLDHVLLHEMCHIRGGDMLLQRAALLLHVLYWFHPLLGPVRSRLRRLSELCCDEHVVRLLEGRIEGYRATILRSMEPLLRSGDPSGWERLGRVGLLERAGDLSERLSRLSGGAPSRAAGATTAVVFLLAAGTILPMWPRTDRAGVDVPYLLLQTVTFTPAGEEEAYLDRLVLVVKEEGDERIWEFHGQAVEGEDGPGIRLKAPILSMPDASEDCRGRLRGPVVREDRTLGFPVQVFGRVRAPGEVGPIEEVHLAPDFHCRSLKVVVVSPEGVSLQETAAVRIGEAWLGETGWISELEPDPSLPPAAPTEHFLRDPESAFPSVRALMEFYLRAHEHLPLESAYRRQREERTEETDDFDDRAPGRVRPFDYPFQYLAHAAIGPSGEYFLAGHSAHEIHLCSEEGSILEGYPVGMQDLPAQARFFSVDASGRLHALLPEEGAPTSRAHRWPYVRIFDSPDGHFDLDLHPEVILPLDFTTDGYGRYYVLSGGGERGNGRPGETSPGRYRVDRYSSDGVLEASVSLTPWLPRRSELPVRPLSGRGGLAVTTAGDTYLLTRSWGVEAGRRALQGELFQVDWGAVTLRRVEVEAPEPGMQLMGVYGVRDAVALEWTPEPQPHRFGRSPTLPMRRKLQLRHGAAVETLGEVDGVVLALSPERALVLSSRRPLDSPALHLVDFETDRR